MFRILTKYIVGIIGKLASLDSQKEAKLCSGGNGKWSELSEQTHAVFEQDYLGVQVRSTRTIRKEKEKEEEKREWIQELLQR